MCSFVHLDSPGVPLKDSLEQLLTILGVVLADIPHLPELVKLVMTGFKGVFGPEPEPLALVLLALRKKIFFTNQCMQCTKSRL